MAVHIYSDDCPIRVGYLRPCAVQVLRFLFFSVFLVSATAWLELFAVVIMSGLIPSV
ncbi:MAG: hypothetical protein IJQ08_05120 [Synergistaceae bacterium]|nr:hypothetical protein [Synergistaceae bacterium]